jgi:hypothetical protein
MSLILSMKVGRVMFIKEHSNDNSEVKYLILLIILTSDKKFLAVDNSD